MTKAKSIAQSHLLQMRGLKLTELDLEHLALVASFTDAWIETERYRSINKLIRSHLLQMRGLKLWRCQE